MGKIDIKDFLNYRVGVKTLGNRNPKYRFGNVLRKDMPVIAQKANGDFSVFADELAKYNMDMRASAKRDMYNVDENYINTPYYMLTENELAYTIDMNRFGFRFTGSDADDFVYLTEMLFGDAELEYEFLQNLFSGTEYVNKDFLFDVSTYYCEEEYKTLLNEMNTTKDKARKEFLAKGVREYEQYMNDRNEYDGKFPRYNELWSKIYRCTRRDDFSDSLDAYKEISSLEYTQLMFFLEQLVTIKNWQKWKKVYSLSGDLYDDFMANFKDGKDIEVPLSVLSNIPFDIFYLNLRDKNIRRASVQGKRNILDGMFIKLLRDGDRILGFALVMNEVMDGDYVTGTILIDLDMFDKDEHDIILFSFERMQEILAKGRFGFDVGKYGGDRKATKEDEVLRTRYLKFFVKTFYVAIQTIFYLCCTNKRVSNTHYVNANPTVKNIKTEDTVEDVTIGFVFTNELRQKIKESGDGEADEVLVNNTGKRTHRPHLVKGHPHHYWTKKGLVLKYVEPYFTGINADKYISKTVCRK